MEIASKKYFGMIIHVEQTRVKVPQEDQDMKDKSMGQTHSSELKFELYHTIGIYVSRECSNAIKQDHKQTNQKSLTVTKLSNITSSRRVISAVNNLRDWPQHRSLLKPSVDDIYFQLPEKYDPAEVAATDNFNEAQSRTIAIADCMFDDLQERMHLVHGPPGRSLLIEPVPCMIALFRHWQESNDRGHRLETLTEASEEEEDSSVRSVEQCLQRTMR